MIERVKAEAWEECFHCPHVVALHLGPAVNWNRKCLVPNCNCPGFPIAELPDEMFGNPREKEHLAMARPDKTTYNQGSCMARGTCEAFYIDHEARCYSWESCKYAQHDPVKHPSHYTSHPSGVECIAITEHYNFCLGNAIKYLWRAGLKQSTDPVQDLEKAAWYIQREIMRLKGLKSAARAGTNTTSS